MADAVTKAVQHAIAATMTHDQAELERAAPEVARAALQAAGRGAIAVEELGELLLDALRYQEGRMDAAPGEPLSGTIFIDGEIDQLDLARRLRTALMNKGILLR
jgi:hypothetical protein